MHSSSTIRKQHKTIQLLQFVSLSLSFEGKDGLGYDVFGMEEEVIKCVNEGTLSAFCIKKLWIFKGMIHYMQYEYVSWI